MALEPREIKNHSPACDSGHTNKVEVEPGDLGECGRRVSREYHTDMPAVEETELTLLSGTSSLAIRR